MELLAAVVVVATLAAMASGKVPAVLALATGLVVGGLLRLAPVPALFAGLSAYGDVGRHPDYERIPDVLVARLEAPLFYANATLVRDQVKRLVGSAEPMPKVVVLDIGANSDLDITSTDMLDQLVDSLRGAGIDFALADARQPVVDMLGRSGLVEKVGADRVYRTVDDAVSALRGAP